MSMRVLVCGGGSAGCAVSARLARSDCEVTLVESGGTHGAGALPASLARRLRPIFDGDSRSYSARIGGRPHPVSVPGGRALGGSSTINGTVALRGHPEHFDAWEAHVAGFGWDTWLPWFIAGERDCDFGLDPWHGSEGPTLISRENALRLRPLQHAFAEAAVGCGHEWIEDHNAPGALGVGPIPLTARGGVRQTAAEAYLPDASRRRIRLLTGHDAQRIVFEGPRAIGVRVRSAGAERFLDADAVIATLGAVETPRLLLHSGVGPRWRLRSEGVEAVAENEAVGAQMLDHARLTLRFKLREPAAPAAWWAPYQVALSSTLTVDDRTRYLQVLPYCEDPQRHLRGTTVVHIQLLDPDAGADTGLAPRQPGAPGDDVVLAGLREPGERRFAQQALDYVRTLLRTPPLESMIEEIDAGAAIEERLGSFFHLAGSCPIGGPGQAAAADPDGRVRGTANVYVMDAAAMPALPSANIHLSVLALADRLAAAFCAGNGLS